ncbi:MAG: hypothetical protein KGH94_00500 [Candidatus Micrarchaeota archaeon]|nr:hypothetical protein [Candidatus Micrarchaeota archaeon]
MEKRPAARKLQSDVEYLVVYGAALLVMLIAITYLFHLFQKPGSEIPNTCTFSAGVRCADLVIGTNTITSNTAVVLLLSNSGTLPITTPTAKVNILGHNSSWSQCIPGYVKAGGLIICIVNVSTKSFNGQLMSGDIYFNAVNCAFSSTSNCQSPSPVSQTYKGSFEGSTQPTSSYKINVTISAESNTLPPNGQRDDLYAQVKLLGYTINGATVNFSANNTVPLLGGQICGLSAPVKTCSSFTNTNTSGVARTNIWSFNSVVVRVYANFSLYASANTVIVFGFASTPLAGSCSGFGSGQIKTIQVTDLNYSQNNPIVPTGSYQIYVIQKLTSLPITISPRQNGGSYCYDVDTRVGGGTVTLTQNGNNEQSVLYVSGNGNVVTDEVKNNGNVVLVDSGNGSISATTGQNNDDLTMSTGTGNMILTLQGNNEAVANITTGAYNAVFNINGNNQFVNVKDTSPDANVLISIGGLNQYINMSFAQATTVTMSIPSGNDNNNVFNSIGGSITITSIQSSGNTFNFNNEAVEVNNCASGNKINLLGSSHYVGVGRCP